MKSQPLNKPKMKVSELIKHLEAFADDLEVEVAVRVSTRAYPVVYVGGERNGGFIHEPTLSPYDMVRLTISLPDGYSVAKRGEK
jgi:hypothetical protein